MKVYLVWKKDFCGDLNDVVLKIFRSAGEANTFLEDLAIKEGLTHDDFGGYPICCPDHGSFTAWKKANGYIVKLIIPNDAKRGSALRRKCRADKAICGSGAIGETQGS